MLGLLVSLFMAVDIAPSEPIAVPSLSLSMVAVISWVIRNTGTSHNTSTKHGFIALFAP